MTIYFNINYLLTGTYLMKRFGFSMLLSSLAFFSHTQAPMRPGSSLVVGRLEDSTEAIKHVAEASVTAKSQAEARSELNRLLVIAAFDFVQITRRVPSHEVCPQAMDRSLERFDPLMSTFNNRQEVAGFYTDLMDIVGIDSSDGHRDAFVARSPAVIRKASK